MEDTPTSLPPSCTSAHRPGAQAQMGLSVPEASLTSSHDTVSEEAFLPHHSPQPRRAGQGAFTVEASHKVEIPPPPPLC